MRFGRPLSRSTIRALALVSFVFFPLNLSAIPTTQQTVDRLGAEDPADRSAAEVQLRGVGAAAIGPLQIAATDPRPEVSDRARRTLRRIQISMLPDQPPRALSTAAKYLDEADPLKRKTLLNNLFEMQPPQVNPLLARLAVLEWDEDARHQILYRLGIDYRRSVGRWLTIDQDQQGVLRMLNGASEMWGGDAAADNAAALGICGLLDQQIRIYQAEQANGDTDEAARAARQLCFFYRWKNQPELALKAARESREPSLIFLALGDQGKWDQAAMEEDDRWHDAVITASMRAGYQRLAGHYDKAIQTMLGLSSVVTPDEGKNYFPSKFFLLNDLPGRGMELMVAQHPVEAFQMHVARGEIAQAIEVAGKYTGITKEGRELENRLAELRRQLDGMPEKVSFKQSIVKQSNWAWHKAVNDLAHQRYWEATLEFAAMWEADPSQYDRLYLQGYSLKMAGDIEDGQKLMQMAEMVPLGEPDARWEFAGQLDAAGLADMAEAQRQMGLRGGEEFDEVGFTKIEYMSLLQAIKHTHWQQAADAADRLCLMSLSLGISWRDAEVLLTLPAQAHLLKARRDREQGDLSAAIAELKMYEVYLPVSTDLVLEWTPALDDLGQKDKADTLFDGVYSRLKAICDQYPRSIFYQNQLAWMCACCGRKLDDALARAELAVSLNPKNWQTMDTLAEIHFRRGERQKAVDLERQAVGLSSDSYLARQLGRFENAAIPSTTQPGVAPE